MQISDLEADYEESQRNIQQLKKKAQRLTAELQDTKLHLEGQQSRNHDLEKKQRKSVHKHTQSSFTCHVITQFYYFTYLCLVPGRLISNGVITTVIVNKLQCFMCVCIYIFERFDSELSAAQDEVQRERSLREKLAREKDVLTGEVFGLRQQLEVCVSVGYTVARCFSEGVFLFLGLGALFANYLVSDTQAF